MHEKTRINKEGKLENKKNSFELKNEGYRDSIKESRQDMDGITHLELLTVESFTSHINDVIPILSP